MARTAGASYADGPRGSAQTLKILENDGFIQRDAQPVIPPRVDYSLTERGEELTALLLPLMGWVMDHAEEIVGPRDDTSR